MADILNLKKGYSDPTDLLGITSWVSSATITVGTETAGTTINVAVQFTDPDGTAITSAVSVPFYLAGDAAGQTIGTAPSGGIAIGTDGLMIEWTANVAGMLTSEADGDVDINMIEAGALTNYLVLVMPDGSLVISDAITHAA